MNRPITAAGTQHDKVVQDISKTGTKSGYGGIARLGPPTPTDQLDGLGHAALAYKFVQHLRARRRVIRRDKNLLLPMIFQ